MIAYFKGEPILGPGGGGSGGGNPIGTIISFMGLAAPAGYLVCDGAEYRLSEYPALADLFRRQFGRANYFGGDGTTTFAVPDMRNLFLRGHHGEAEEQLSGKVGAKQNGTSFPAQIALGGSNGKIPSVMSAPGGTIAFENADSCDGTPTVYSYDTTPVFGSISVVGDGVEKAEKFTARPVNMAVLFCIKAIETDSGSGSPDGGADLTAGEVYSTEETRIGTWIDGKPLYRKVIAAQTGDKISMSTEDLNSLYDARNLNIETLCSMEATSLAWSGATWITPPTTVNFSKSYSMTVFIDNGILKERHTIAEYSNCPIYITIAYTKTTD